MSIRDEIMTATGVVFKKSMSVQEFYRKLVDKSDEKLSQEEFDSLSEEAQEWLNTAVSVIDNGGTEIAGFPDEVEEETEEEYVEEDDEVKDEDEEEGDEDNMEEEEEVVTKPKKVVKASKVEIKKPSKVELKKPVAKKVELKKPVAKVTAPAPKVEAKKPVVKEKAKPEPKVEVKKPAVKVAVKTTKKAGGVSSSLRVVQLAVEFPEASFSDIDKMMKKEKLELNISTIRTKAWIAREALRYLKEIGRLKK